MDCLACSDTNEVNFRIAQKKYRKRVQASCSQGKGGLSYEAQLKWIGNSHHALWEHDHEIIRMEWDCALGEDCSSFELHKMMVRTDQLLLITEATNTKVYTCESEARAHGQMKSMVLSLKQYHACVYWLYEKGITRALVGLQGLHSGETFKCSNVSSSVGLKSFCPWCFKLGGTARQWPPILGRCTTGW